MRFKLFLLEQKMSVDKALEIFNLDRDEASDKTKLRKKYKELSIKFHPDHGGTNEQMRDINLAYEVLNKLNLSSSGEFDWKESAEEYRKLGKRMKKMLVSLFNEKIYVNYLNKLSGKNFNYEYIRKFPSENENNPSYAGFDIKFKSDDNETFFDLHLSVTLHQVKHNKSLGGGNDEYFYKIFYYVTGYHEGKDVKIKQRSIGSSDKKNIFINPEVAFSKARMKKIFSGEVRKGSKFKKSDMFGFLRNKLNATFNDDVAFIPLFDNYKLVIYRMVMMRVPSWGFNGIYERSKRISRMGVVSLPENEETARMLEEWVEKAKKMKSIDKVIQFFNNSIEEYKRKNK